MYLYCVNRARGCVNAFRKPERRKQFWFHHIHYRTHVHRKSKIKTYLYRPLVNTIPNVTAVTYPHYFNSVQRRLRMHKYDNIKQDHLLSMACHVWFMLMCTQTHVILDFVVSDVSVRVFHFIYYWIMNIKLCKKNMYFFLFTINEPKNQTLRIQ